MTIRFEDNITKLILGQKEFLSFYREPEPQGHSQLVFPIWMFVKLKVHWVKFCSTLVPILCSAGYNPLLITLSTFVFIYTSVFKLFDPDCGTSEAADRDRIVARWLWSQKPRSGRSSRPRREDCWSTSFGVSERGSISSPFPFTVELQGGCWTRLGTSSDGGRNTLRISVPPTTCFKLRKERLGTRSSTDLKWLRQ